MKRTLALLLALVMVLSLAACGSRKAPAASTSPAADGSQSVSGKISCLTSRTDLDTVGTYAALIASSTRSTSMSPW